MSFVPVPNTLLAEMRMTCEGQRLENTLYFRMDTTPTIGAATGLANALIIWWSTQYANLLSQNLSLVEVAMTDLSSATSFVHEQAAPIPHPVGGSGDDNEPLNVALAVSFRTNSRGRSFRGRNYVAALATGRVNGSLVDAGFVGGIQAAYQALISLAVDNGGEWVVVSRISGGAPRVTGLATSITEAVVVDNVVDSQRRRLPGRGL